MLWVGRKKNWEMCWSSSSLTAIKTGVSIVYCRRLRQAVTADDDVVIIEAQNVDLIVFLISVLINNSFTVLVFVICTHKFCLIRNVIQLIIHSFSLTVDVWPSVMETTNSKTVVSILLERSNRSFFSMAIYFYFGD